MSESNRNEPNKVPPRRPMLTPALVLLLAFLLIQLLPAVLSPSKVTEISYSDFLHKLEAGELKKVFFDANRILITPKGLSDEPTMATGYVGDDALVGLLKAADVVIDAQIPQVMSPIVEFLLTFILPLALLGGLFYLFSRTMSKRMGGSGGFMSFGKSNSKIYAENETGQTFADVAGQDEAKDSLLEIVDFLNRPQKYLAIGAKLPKGALLVGPPGTGKTLLARAVAGEAKVPFFSLTGSAFVELFAGMGASRVRDLFRQAEQKAPCIVFIDEIDAIGRSRDDARGFGSDSEREQTLNQLLSEMDGFDPSKGVVILAATNRPDVLDKALLRPGRFDRRIPVEKPDLAGRLAVLQVHAKDVRMSAAAELSDIAKATPGAVGADLANIINEAALNAVRAGRQVVEQADLTEAVETTLAGQEKKGKVLSPREKKIVAYHETGHALAAACLPNAEKVHKVTIVPRTMGTLGYTLQVPEEDKSLHTKDEAIAEIVTLLAGRAAEEVVFNTLTTGAASDIERATQLARAMITQYGMSETFDMVQLESVQNPYLGSTPLRNHSEATAALVDNEVGRIIRACHKQATDLLTEHRVGLDAIAGVLIEKESLDADSFAELFRLHVGEMAKRED